MTLNKVFVFSLNRSLRKYIYQMILMKEFKKTGLEIIFLNFQKFNKKIIIITNARNNGETQVFKNKNILIDTYNQLHTRSNYKIKVNEKLKWY